MKACAAGVSLELPSAVLSEPDLSRILSLKTCAPESRPRAQRACKGASGVCLPTHRSGTAQGSRVECALRCGGAEAKTLPGEVGAGRWEECLTEEERDGLRAHLPQHADIDERTNLQVRRARQG